MHLWNTSLQSLELGLQKVQKAKDNASKKVYHHTQGQGGYKLAIPKWEKMEHDLLDRGIQLATMNWPERSRTWFYGHGGSLGPLTGHCIYGPNIQRAAQRLQEAIQAATERIFQPDRERDEVDLRPWESRAFGSHKRQRCGSVEIWVQGCGHLAYLFGFSWNREIFLKLPPAPFFFSFGYRIPFLAWIGSFPELEADRDVVPDNTSGLSYEFFGGSFWSDRFAIWTNFRYNEPPFQFFGWASLRLFLLRR